MDPVGGTKPDQPRHDLPRRRLHLVRAHRHRRGGAASNLISWDGDWCSPSHSQARGQRHRRLRAAGRPCGRRWRTITESCLWANAAGMQVAAYANHGGQPQVRAAVAAAPVGDGGAGHPLAVGTGGPHPHAPPARRGVARMAADVELREPIERAMGYVERWARVGWSWTRRRGRPRRRPVHRGGPDPQGRPRLECPAQGRRWTGRVVDGKAARRAARRPVRHSGQPDRFSPPLVPPADFLLRRPRSPA